MADSYEDAITLAVSKGDTKNGPNYPRPDLTYLKNMAGSDENFVAEIINHFFEYAPELLNSMRENARMGDNEKLRFDAHKLLPQLTFVGITAAIPLVTKIEIESRSGKDLSDVTEKAISIINEGMDELKKMI